MSTPEPTPGKGGPWTPPHGGDGPGNGPGDAGTKKRPATKDAKDQKKKGQSAVLTRALFQVAPNE